MESQKPRRKNLAQTASELAIFGALLIFIIGAMVRSSVNAGYNQNQTLKAFRMALRASFDSSRSAADDGSGDVSRSNASILFLEDRTTPDADKYGSATRTPYIISASGTFSKNLMKTTDWGTPTGRPLYDMHINGQYFIFMVADYREYDISQNGSPWATPGFTKFIPPGTDWVPSCAKNLGCRRVYSMTPNIGPKNPNWCISDCSGAATVCTNACDTAHAACVAGCPGGFAGLPCKAACGTTRSVCISACPNGNMTEDDRFDLWRDGLGGPDDVPAALRASFSWQWVDVLATTRNISVALGKNTSVDVDGDLKEEQVLEVVDRNGKTWNLDKQPDDKYSETPIDIVRVMDYQEGDMDFGYNTHDQKVLSKPVPGIGNDMQMYSYSQDGTYLAIQEGQPYNLSNNFVTSIQKKNKLDLVQRTIQLSNDTGRFCRWDANFDPSRNQGVEACVPGSNGCFAPDNISRTCFDREKKILYVRSKILDLRGRKWITDITP